MKFLLFALLASSVFALECWNGNSGTIWSSSGSEDIEGCTGTLAAVASSTEASQCGTGELAIWINTADTVTALFDFVLSTSSTAFTFNAPIKATKISGTVLQITSLECTDCVAQESIAPEAIGSTELQSDIITAGHIKAGAVNTSEIAGNAVGTSEIADKAVTNAKIGSKAVTSDKIATNLNIGGSLTVGDALQSADGCFKVYDGSDDWEISGHSAAIVLKGWARIEGQGIRFTEAASMSGAYYTYLRYHSNGVHRNSDWSSDELSLYTTQTIMSKTYIGASDRRIKNNIMTIPDSLSLDIVRKLDAKYYNYKDTFSRGTNRTIGFIAQDVREHLPEAVTIITDFIPNEMRSITPIWTKRPDGNFTTTVEDLAEPGKYRVMVKKNEGEETLEWETESDGKTFVSDHPHEVLFLYGREVDDFHAIDKQKIFAVAYSALQQVDKTQQALVDKVASLEAMVASLVERITTIEAK